LSATSRRRLSDLLPEDERPQTKAFKDYAPGSLHARRKNSLDALCAEYGIDRSHRQLHGALLDAELLAEVYLAMTDSQVSD